MLDTGINETNDIVKQKNNDMNEKVNIELIIERAMIAFKCGNQKQLADLFKVSPEDLSNRKRRGTLTKLIEKEAYRNKISYDWIKTGQGNMKNGRYETAVSPANPVSDTDTAYQSKNNTADLVHKTRAVLGSNTAYSTALKDIIVAYYEATICQEELAEKKKALDSRPAVNGS